MNVDDSFPSFSQIVPVSLVRHVEFGGAFFRAMDRENKLSSYRGWHVHLSYKYLQETQHEHLPTTCLAHLLQRIESSSRNENATEQAQ